MQNKNNPYTHKCTNNVRLMTYTALNNGQKKDRKKQTNETNKRTNIFPNPRTQSKSEEQNVKCL